MDEEFDYSRYKHCIFLVLDHHSLHFKSYEVGSYFKDRANVWVGSKYVPSFVYDTTSKTVIAEDFSADRLMSEIEEPQENLLYIPNAFTELYNICAKQQEDHCEQNWLDDVQQTGIHFLQRYANARKLGLDCSEVELCYVFTIPTGWNENIKEELIRPLFIKSGVLNEEDDQCRLIIYTDLELKFRYLQSTRFREVNVAMNQGHQYIIMSLYIQQEIHVNLNLVSAQYPGFKTVDSRYVPQLLKDFSFTIPFGSCNVKSSLTTCLEKICDSELVLKIIDEMLKTLKESIRREHVQTHRRPRVHTIPGPLTYTLSWRPFCFVDLEYCYDSKYSRKEFDLMTDNIRLLTVEDAFQDFYPSIAKNCMNGISTLLQGTDNIKARSLVIFNTEDISTEKSMLVVLGLVEKWAKTRSEEQDSPYELIGELIRDKLNFVYEFDARQRMEMANVLVRKQMNDFNIRRDPIILPRDSSNEEYGGCLKPVYFINIDLLPTQNKITLTYVNEKSRIEQMESIECNIQPLYTFFKQTELCRRPQLHIDNSIKILLEKMFAEYLIIYSKSDQQKPSSRIIQPEIKTTFGSCFGIKTNKNWPKEIRSFFASSSPRLLEQVMQNVKTDDLFMKNNSSCSDDTNLLDTSDTGYILFFTIAYLHNLNMLLNKELDKKFGNDWRGKNIWYGVSVDKHLLETVFVSKKKLEKLFYASGILVKDDNLRRAKFCVCGEDILPAIQQTLDLKLKMKSYFVVAHIFPQHVQLTLHQTVKLASPGEDAATIVIEDKIVYFDDVYDELCQNIWKNMQPNCQIDYCITHKGKKNEEFDFGSFQAYRDIRQTFKQLILELLKNDSHNLDMNLCTKLNISDKCSCHMVISLRFIIEIGLQSVIENIVTTLAASLINYDQFGHYKSGYLFLLGDPFNLSYGSPSYAMYTTILQRAMDDSIQSKGKDTQAFVMKNSLDQLLYLFKNIKPHMFDRFINGTLCQVSSNTYGFRLRLSENRYQPFDRLNSKGVVKNYVESQGGYLIFIDEGKPLSKTKTIVRLNLKDEYRCPFPKFDMKYARYFYENLAIVVIRSRQSSRTKLKKYDLLDKSTKGQWYELGHNIEESVAYDFILDCKHLNYNYSLELGIKRMSKFQSVNDYYKIRVLEEPLTLAYI